MIKRGDTIVYKHDDKELGMMFYWLCDIVNGMYVFFNWCADPDNASPCDFWRISAGWLERNVTEGRIEIYDSFPSEKYGDIFKAQLTDASLFLAGSGEARKIIIVNQ